MDRIRKLKNISEVQIPIILKGNTTVYVPPKGTLENVQVENYHSISRFVKAEVDLGEVKESKVKGKKYLKG